jgi:RimJ/RimL family protein N-acetyltransferase
VGKHPEPVIETARLQLRPLVAADAAFILQLLNEPSWLRWIGDRGVRTLAQAGEYIRTGPQASYARDGFGFYLVLRPVDQASLGICGLVKRDFLPAPDLGFAFLPDYWGQGYAVEAARATIKFARSHLNLEELAAITDPENEASHKLLRRLGFMAAGDVTYPDDDFLLRLWSLALA